MHRLVLPLGRSWTLGSARLRSRLEERFDVECYAITHYRRWAEDAKRLGFPTERVFYINEGFRSRMDSAKVDPHLIERLEEAYGVPNLWPYVLADRHLEGFSHQDLMKVIQIEFTRIESFLDEVRPDGIVLDAVDRLGLLFLYHAAVRRNIPVRVFGASRLRDRFLVVDNPYDHWSAVEREYRRFKREGLSPDLSSEASDFLDNFRLQRTRPLYMKAFERPHPLLLLRQGAWYVRNYYRHSGREEYTSTHPVLHAAKESRKGLAWATTSRLRMLFERPLAGEAFVLFPLHVYPESSVMVLAPNRVDQASLAADIARALPMNYKLYVKEHLASIGMRPPGFYRRLKNLPNVRLISPYEDSHELIGRADLVAVVSSTAGWEAVLYEKPVLTFGRVFYNSFDLVHRAAPLDEGLPEQVRALLREWKPDRKELLTFVAAILSCSHPGELDPGQPRFLELANLDRIAEVIADEFELVPA